MVLRRASYAGDVSLSSDFRASTGTELPQRLVDIDAMTFAREITLIDKVLLIKISWEELATCGWMTKDKVSSALKHSSPSRTLPQGRIIVCCVFTFCQALHRTLLRNFTPNKISLTDISALVRELCTEMLTMKCKHVTLYKADFANTTRRQMRRNTPSWTKKDRTRMSSKVLLMSQIGHFLPRERQVVTGNRGQATHTETRDAAIRRTVFAKSA